MDWVEACDDGAVLRVKAVPGSSRDRIVGRHGDALKVTVTAPPEQGKANDRIAALLAKALGLPRRTVSLLSGSASAHKRFWLQGTSADAVRRLLAETFPP